MADEKKDVVEEVVEETVETTEEEKVEATEEVAEETAEAAAEETAEEATEETAEETEETAEETTDEADTTEETDAVEEADESTDESEESDDAEEKKKEVEKIPTHELINSIENEQIKEVADFKVGDTIVVSAKIIEGNRERVQKFEGLVIKKQGGGNRTTFTVRKDSNGVGVEKTWPLYSPTIAKIEVVREGKVRRAKLNYIKNRVGKAAKVKELVK